MLKIGSRRSLFWTFCTGLSNPWVVVMLAIRPERNSVAKIKLLDQVLPIGVSGIQLKPLYYFCCLRKISTHRSGLISISLPGGDIVYTISDLLKPRILEMMVYANIYGPLGLELREFDNSHYLAEVIQHDQSTKLIVDKNDGVGIIGEVFCDNVYGRLSGDVKGKTVIDVGAFIGDTAIFFAKNGAREIYAYESDESFYKLAKENVIRNDIRNVHLYNYSVGENLGQIIRDIGNVGLLKMDCEGCEYPAIDSLSNDSLAKIEKIVLEYHGSPDEIVRKLKNSNFDVMVEKAWTKIDKKPIGFLVATRNLKGEAQTNQSTS